MTSCVPGACQVDLSCRICYSLLGSATAIVKTTGNWPWCALKGADQAPAQNGLLMPWAIRCVTEFGPMFLKAQRQGHPMSRTEQALPLAGRMIR